MKTAVIYARYSSDKQTEQSIEGQLRVCNDFANRNKILVVGTYIDRATTGTNDNRIDFQKMMRDSSKKEWDYIIVYKLDRFSRNKYEMAMHRKTLRDNNVKILSASEHIPETPEGILMESLLEGMAEYYSAELSQKVKRGQNENRQKGLFRLQKPDIFHKTNHREHKRTRRSRKNIAHRNRYRDHLYNIGVKNTCRPQKSRLNPPITANPT